LGHARRVPAGARERAFTPHARGMPAQVCDFPWEKLARRLQVQIGTAPHSHFTLHLPTCRCGEDGDLAQKMHLGRKNTLHPGRSWLYYKGVGRRWVHLGSHLQARQAGLRANLSNQPSPWVRPAVSLYRIPPGRNGLSGTWPETPGQGVPGTSRIYRLRF
jgi:hypothetical protein